MRMTSTTTALLCVVVALALALALTYSDVSLAGFPDGHVTDYGKAVDTPLRIVTWVALGLAVLAVGLAFSPIGPRVRVIGLFAVLAAVAVVAFIAFVGVPWYFGTRLGLDNGIGG